MRKRLQLLGNFLTSFGNSLWFAAPAPKDPTTYPEAGLNFVEVKDDGNCFYYAVAETLKSENKDPQKQYDNSSLRKMVANFWSDLTSSNSTIAPKLQEQRDSLTAMVIADLEEKYQKKIKDIKEGLNTLEFYEIDQERKAARQFIEAQISTLESKKMKKLT